MKTFTFVSSLSTATLLFGAMPEFRLALQPGVIELSGVDVSGENPAVTS